MSTAEEMNARESESAQPVNVERSLEVNEVLEREQVFERSGERRGDFAKNLFTSEMVSNGLDLVPFAGNGKMIVEAVYGGTLSGKSLSGKERIIHGALGAGMLALDFTGAGEVLKFGGKALPLVEKVGAQLAAKGAVNGAAIFAKTAEFMARHPEIVQSAEKFAEAKVGEFIKSHKA